MTSWQVDQGDCLELLRLIPDGEFDVTITDPPYTPEVHAGVKNVYAKTKTGKPLRVVYKALGFEPLSGEDCAKLVSELLRVTRRWVLCFCALEQLRVYQAAAGKAWVRSGIYHRVNAAPQMTGDRPGANCDGVAILHRRGKKRWNGGGSHAFWEAGQDRTEARLHPTQKPVALLLELVRLFSEPGDVVFDPYTGSGTTGVAALRLGRSFYGIEQLSEHVATARERLAAEDNLVSLSAKRGGQLSILDVTHKSERPA